MFCKIFCLLFVINYFCAAAWDITELEGYDAGKAPFFELPCMRIGGTCAQSHACPPGTKVGQRGLCPEQQRFGMECCRPLKGVTECRSRHGACIPRTFKCSKNLRINDATGCGLREMCCLRKAKFY